MDKKKEHKYLAILLHQQENIMNVIAVEIHKDHHLMEIYGNHQQMMTSEKLNLVQEQEMMVVLVVVMLYHLILT